MPGDDLEMQRRGSNPRSNVLSGLWNPREVSKGPHPYMLGP